MHRRFFSYLLLCLVAYACFSYLDQVILRFVFFFLLLLPLMSFISLLLARYFVHWALRVEHPEATRLEEGRGVITLINRSFFFFPHIDLYIDEPALEDGLFIMGDGKDHIMTKEEAANYSGPIRFDDFSNETEDLFLDDSALLQLSEDEYAKRIHKRLSRARAIPKRRFFLFPKFKTLPATSRKTVWLSAYARYDWHFRWMPSHVGHYRFGATHVYARDFLGFFTLPLHQSKSEQYICMDEINVLPNARFYRSRFAQKLPVPQPTDLARFNNRIRPEVNALANIRAYRPGDRMKDIHFKISAKLGDFYVKEFEDPRKGGILFLIDPFLPDQLSLHQRDYFDELSEIATAIVEEFNRGEGPVIMRFANHSIEGPGQNQGLKIFQKFLSQQKLHPAQDRKRADGHDLSFDAHQLSQSQQKAIASDIQAQKEHFLKHRVPSLSWQLQNEFRSEKYRAIVLISPSFTHLLAQTILRSAKQQSTRLIFIHLEPPKDTQSQVQSTPHQAESPSANTGSQAFTPSEAPTNSSNSRPAENASTLISAKERRDYITRMENLNVIVFPVRLRSIHSRGPARTAPPRKKAVAPSNATSNSARKRKPVPPPGFARQATKAQAQAQGQAQRQAQNRAQAQSQNRAQKGKRNESPHKSKARKE